MPVSPAPAEIVFAAASAIRTSPEAMAAQVRAVKGPPDGVAALFGQVCVQLSARAGGAEPVPFT